MTAEMIAYVKAELASGKSPADVRQALLAAGWPPGDVEQALALSLTPTTGYAAAPPPPPPGTAASGWGLGSGGLRFGYRRRSARQLSPGQAMALGAVFMIVGGLVAYLGVQSYFATQALLKSGTRTEGTVVRIEEKVTHDSDGTSRTYRPVIEFEVGNGSTTQFASKISSSSNSYRVGQKINVIFDPAAPEKAVIDSPGEIYGASAIPFGIGIIFVLAGLAVFVSNMRKRAIPGGQPGPTPPPLS